MDKITELLTLKEAAALLRLHKETIRRAIKAGQIKAGKAGTMYRIEKAELLKFFKQEGGDNDSNTNII